MSAFCGWLASPENDPPPATTLEAMAQAYRGRRCEVTSAKSAERALWLTADGPTGLVFAEEDVWVAIIGRPRWRDATLAEEQRARGAARALQRAYHEHGTGLLEHLAGNFAFAVIDRSARKALLAIDRMGIESLYFAKDNRNELIFGSTADLVRAHPRVSATVTLQAIYGYLHAFVCRSPGTIYAEQYKLGPAQYLLWEDGHNRVVTYWRTSFVPDRSRKPEELAEELVFQVRRSVHDAVPEGEVRHVGAFLSGGLDSSTVAGMLKRRPLRSVSMRNPTTRCATPRRRPPDLVRAPTVTI